MDAKTARFFYPIFVLTSKIKIEPHPYVFMEEKGVALFKNKVSSL